MYGEPILGTDEPTGGEEPIDGGPERLVADAEVLLEGGAGHGAGGEGGDDAIFEGRRPGARARGPSESVHLYYPPAEQQEQAHPLSRTERPGPRGHALDDRRPWYRWA